MGMCGKLTCRYTVSRYGTCEGIGTLMSRIHPPGGGGGRNATIHDGGGGVGWVGEIQVCSREGIQMMGSIIVGAL